MSKPLVSVVLGTYNRLNFLKLTIESIRQELKNFSHEIIVIDGGSNDGTLCWLKKQKDIISIVQHNRGFWAGKEIKKQSWGYFMNLGFKISQGKYVCMLSDDCLVIPGAIINGYNLFEEKLLKDEKIGAIAFYWRNWPEETKYSVYTEFGKIFVNHGMYLKQALEEVNYIDEKSFNFYCADSDLTLRMFQSGYVCIDSPESHIEHYSHANLKIREQNRKNYTKDWQNYLEKWLKVFPETNRENPGSRLERKYKDPFRTAEKFMKISQNFLLKRKILEKFMNLLKL